VGSGQESQRLGIQATHHASPVGAKLFHGTALTSSIISLAPETFEGERVAEE